MSPTACVLSEVPAISRVWRPFGPRPVASRSLSSRSLHAPAKKRASFTGRAVTNGEMTLMSVDKIILTDKFSAFSDHCSPMLLLEFIVQKKKHKKKHGDFVWHHHENEDERGRGH